MHRDDATATVAGHRNVVQSGREKRIADTQRRQICIRIGQPREADIETPDHLYSVSSLSQPARRLSNTAVQNLINIKIRENLREYLLHVKMYSDCEFAAYALV